MKVRTLLITTALLAIAAGALVAYLILTVPNDLQADALLKQARQDIATGKDNDARAALTQIMQQYPRTDAAAAATVALVSLARREHDDLVRTVILLRNQNNEQTKRLDELQKTVTEIRNAPPKVVTVTAPPPAAKKPTVKKTPAKKPPPKKRTTTRRRG